MRSVSALPFAFAALLLTGGCAYDNAIGYAPTDYPPGYDSGMGSGLVVQPGDLFRGQNVASPAVFDAPLAPYGQWVNSRYGRAFRPDVPREWRPYVNGQWGEDRLWISNDPWGWATDHYGRWGFDQAVGWVWVPGTEWAPSWVAFRDDPAQNVAGWAPIPPNVSYSLNYGFGTGWGYDSYASWYAPSWVWVPRNYVYQPGFGGRVLPWNYGGNYWGGSRWQSRPVDRQHSFGAPGYRPPQNGNWQGGRPGGRPPRNGLPRNGQPRNGQWQGGNPQGGQWTGNPAGDAGIPGFRAWQPDSKGGGRPTGVQQQAQIEQGSAPRPMPQRAAPRASEREAPRAVERQAPPAYAERPVRQMRVERSNPDAANVRPE